MWHKWHGLKLSNEKLINWQKAYKWEMPKKWSHILIPGFWLVFLAWLMWPKSLKSWSEEKTKKCKELRGRCFNFGHMARNSTAESYGRFIFSFSKIFHTDFQHGSIQFNSHNQGMCTLLSHNLANVCCHLFYWSKPFSLR